MRSRVHIAALGAVAAGALLVPAVAFAAAPGQQAGAAAQAADKKALHAVGLTGNHHLVSFPVDDPAKTKKIGQLKGLKGDTSVIGIDYRVQDNKLYAVGDKGGIYTVNTSNATATKVCQLSVALEGENFGVDFNPAANRLRVISDTGQNLRHNIDDPQGAPEPGVTVVDTPLTNPPVPPADPETATGVTGAAYTNNDLDAGTATTLFDINTMTDQVVIQSPANNGTLAPTGGLGVDTGPKVGFDIYTWADQGTNEAFASLDTGDGQVFHRVNLLTGTATAVGPFKGGHEVVDFSVPTDQG